MAEIVTHITDARNNGTINVYAVRYMQRDRSDNVAVALPGNVSFELRHDFCDNVIRFEEAQEVDFNPTAWQISRTAGGNPRSRISFFI